MKNEWIDSLILFVLLWVSIEFNLNKGILASIALIFVIGHAIFEYYRRKAIINTNKDAVFQFKNTRWIFILPAVLIMGFIIIWNIDSEMLQITNALLFLLYTYFIASRESIEIFLIDQYGIKYLNKGKYIPPENILEIERDSDTLMIHTSKWWNHINFKAKNLKPPRTFEELISGLDQLHKIKTQDNETVIS